MTPDVDTPSEDPDKPRVPIEQMFERLYEELRSVARHYMRGERVGHSLQPTDLVHKAYLRLINSGVTIVDRVHFLRLAARTMKRILIEHARGKPGLTRVTLTDDAGVIFPEIDLLDFDRALDRLESLDERQALIIELRFIVGLTVEEVAAELSVSPRTIKGDTRVALAWLRRELDNA